ncbi:MAG: DUF1552 domain-containing protein [Verrucomicrobia bacterium]|nr:DUF1552 domain-containing protein [Verrucomicrobiota bacterium]
MKSRTSVLRKADVSRRNFLKAAGISIALPAFESLALPSQTKPPMRMVCICTGLGMHPESFFPKAYGRGYELSPVLSPLAGLRDDYTVFSHMDHPGIFTKHGAMSSILSGVTPAHAEPGEYVSMDQVAAQHVGYQTRFPSVHISLAGSQGSSWSSSGIKVREEGDPFDLFQKLFVNDSDAAKMERKLELDQQGSVLDLVRGQAKHFERNINAPDRSKLDEYLTAVREAEQKIQGMKRWEDVPKPKVKFDEDEHAHSSVDYEVLSPLMFDLLFLAIQSDTSRVFTAGFGMHNKVIELDGVTDGYHGLSHHGNRPDKLKQLQIIETFYIAQMARFMDKLKSARTEQGHLLNETMVWFGSGLGDAARHSNRDLPLILAGGGFKHGEHLDCKQPTGTQTPLNNLFTTMLQNFGVETDRFNNATGTMSQLKA